MRAVKQLVGAHPALFDLARLSDHVYVKEDDRLNEPRVTGPLDYLENVLFGHMMPTLMSSQHGEASDCGAARALE